MPQDPPSGGRRTPFSQEAPEHLTIPADSWWTRALDELTTPAASDAYRAVTSADTWLGPSGRLRPAVKTLTLARLCRTTLYLAACAALRARAKGQLDYDPDSDSWRTTAALRASLTGRSSTPPTREHQPHG